MKRKIGWVRLGAVAVATAITASVLATGSASAGQQRVAGSTRVGTAVAIAQRSFPDGATTVYLARADVVADALAAGSLTDGPVLVVPSCGDVPSEVATEIGRLDPEEVVGLGGSGAVCDATLATAGVGRTTSRLAGADRMATAAAVAARAFPDGAPTVYLASATSPADAVAAGSLTDGPVLLVPGTGTVPPSVADAIEALDPMLVVALGGTGAVSDPVVTSAAAGRSTTRVAGNGRVETAVAIAERAYPDGAATVYLARADVFADAIAAGSLTDGPLLLHASCGELAPSVASELSRLRPSTVIALGGSGAICDELLTSAAAVQPASCLYAESDASCPSNLDLEVVTDLPAGDPEIAAIVAGIEAGAAQGLVGRSEMTLLAIDDPDALAEEYASRTGDDPDEVRTWLETSEAFTDHRGIIVFNVSLPRARRGTNLKFLFKTAVHEWFHSYQQHTAGGRFPFTPHSWLTEGVAEWFAWDVASRNGRADMAEFLRDAGKRYAVPRFESEGISLADLEGSGFVTFGSSYELTPLAIDHLVARTSLNAVLRDLWAAMPDSTMADAFESAFGMSEADFYRTADPYLAGLRAEGDAPPFPS